MGFVPGGSVDKQRETCEEMWEREIREEIASTCDPLKNSPNLKYQALQAMQRQISDQLMDRGLSNDRRDKLNYQKDIIKQYLDRTGNKVDSLAKHRGYDSVEPRSSMEDAKAAERVFFKRSQKPNPSANLRPF